MWVWGDGLRFLAHGSYGYTTRADKAGFRKMLRLTPGQPAGCRE